jgi:hypothetical protein
MQATTSRGHEISESMRPCCENLTLPIPAVSVLRRLFGIYRTTTLWAFDYKSSRGSHQSERTPNSLDMHCENEPEMITRSGLGLSASQPSQRSIFSLNIFVHCCCTYMHTTVTPATLSFLKEELLSILDCCIQRTPKRLKM